MGIPAKEVNFVASKAYEDNKETKNLDNEIRYLANYSGIFQPVFQSQSENQGCTDHKCDRDWRDWDRDYERYLPPHDWEKNKQPISMDLKKYISKDVLANNLMKVEGTNKMIYAMKRDFSQLSQTVVSHSASIK